MKTSDYVIRFLHARGVTHVFELAGGMLAHLLDSANQLKLVELVSTHHEQAAGFAAEGMARMTGVPGVAFATSGPGATNLLTAIGSCYFDSTPAVFITGAVARNEQKGDRLVRQQGFQETDIVAMAKPITKLALRATDPAAVPNMLALAFEYATSGRPGPVLLDLPLDVSGAEIDIGIPPTITFTSKMPTVYDTDVKVVMDGLARAKRPLILVGGGCAGVNTGAVRIGLNHLGVPVVNSLMGTDVLGHDHPLRVGLIGSYGNRWANTALGESDFLLVLGSRLDIRQTGTDVRGFGAREIVQVDVDCAEMNNRVMGVHAVHAKVSDFLFAVERRPAFGPSKWADWKEHIDALRKRWPDTEECKPLGGVNPNDFMRRLGLHSAFRPAAYVVDVGQHQMWAAQSLEFPSSARFLTSGGMGAMGFALPAAIGASFTGGSAPKPVVVIAGDGGFQLNGQELETIAHHRLPVKMVILNNGCHGMVRQFQDAYFEGRRQSTVVGYSAPSFVRVAEAYGIPAMRLLRPEGMPEAFDWLWGTPGPALLEVEIDTEANVFPKLAFGRGLTEMEPDVKPLWIEGA